jgi:hypothetical protein
MPYIPLCVYVCVMYVSVCGLGLWNKSKGHIGFSTVTHLQIALVFIISAGGLIATEPRCNTAKQ